MKIKLENPYKERYKFGYVVMNRENRKHIILYNSNKDRTTTSLARYLMSVKLGYLVPETYEVDHKDNDKTNDSIDNLQLLTQTENKIKEGLRQRTKEHGTLSSYRYCKCTICRKANSIYHKQGKEAYLKYIKDNIVYPP